MKMEGEGPGRVLRKDVVGSKSHLNPHTDGVIPVLQPQQKEEFVGSSRQLQLGLMRFCPMFIQFIQFKLFSRVVVGVFHLLHQASHAGNLQWH